VNEKYSLTEKRSIEFIMNADSEHNIPLRRHVQDTISRYLKDMGNTAPANIYQMLLAEIEPPLIEEVLKCTGGNQSRAAAMLGITRNTLRTKMQRYSITAQTSKITRLRQ
jgi:Fis family transcriptional regulator